MNKNDKIKCLFGFHTYTIPYKTNPDILLCKHCERFGYYKGFNGREAWCEFDEKGNLIHFKDSDGYESWYDKEGNVIRRKEAIT